MHKVKRRCLAYLINPILNKRRHANLACNDAIYFAEKNVNASVCKFVIIKISRSVCIHWRRKPLLI